MSEVRKKSAEPLHRYDDLLAGLKRSRAARRTGDGLRTPTAPIVIVGRGGLVVLADEEGRAFHRLTLSNPGGKVTPSLIGVAECPDGTIAALDFYRAVWTSRDPARGWVRHALPVNEDPAAITCDPAGRLWVAASFTTILHSSDGGKTWRQSSFGEDAVLTHIQFFDDQHAIAIGEFGLVYKSRDGGVSWEAAPPLPNEFYPAAALFIDQDHGWVGGLDGIIYATSDGGAHWQRQPTPTQAPIFHFFAGPAQPGEEAAALFAVGENGTVLRLMQARWVRAGGPVNSQAFLRVGLTLGTDRILVGGAGGFLSALAVPPRPRPEGAGAAPVAASVSPVGSADSGG